MVFVVCTVFMDVGMVFMDVDLQAGAAAGRYVWGKYGRAPHAALFPRKDNHLPCPYVFTYSIKHPYDPPLSIWWLPQVRGQLRG